MKQIAYYISDNGFGHASRGIGLIRELAKYNDLQILVKTGRPLRFIKRSLVDNSNINFFYSKNDVGLILKENSLQINKDKLKKKLIYWVESWEELVLEEKVFLHSNEVDLIISDITPWPLLAGKSLGIKTVGISNFTWYEIYEDLLGPVPAVKEIKKAYEQNDVFLKLPLNLKLKAVNKMQEIGFISRKTNNEKVKKIKRKIGMNKKLIYVGVGKSVDLKVLNKLEVENSSDYNWLFSSGVNLNGDNIYTIPETATETQNYIAACDYVITKPGWSTVTEAVLAGVPLLLINRNEVIEDKRISEQIKRLNLGISISQQKLNNLNFKEELRKLDVLQRNSPKYKNKVDLVAQKIVNLI